MPTVRLFIPCLVDNVYPEMGFAMLKILKHFGYTVEYNSEQTCCGQPAFNAGHLKEAKAVANHCLSVFAEDDSPIISPSGSCTAMIRNYYKELLDDESVEVEKLCANIYEFSEFMIKNNHHIELQKIIEADAGIRIHNSCHSARELGLKTEIYSCMNQPCDTEEPVCCGFGGLFSVKFPDIAESMGKARMDHLLQGDKKTIISNDPGCIMHLRQIITHDKLDYKILHLWEYLAEKI